MRRRDFIKVIAVSVAWPLAARAQQPEQMRRIGVLMNRAASDPEGQARLAAFRQALEQLGWSEGRNVRIDVRWGEDNFDLERKYASELIRARARRHPCQRHRKRDCVAIPQPYITDRVRGSRRSRRCRFRRVHGAFRAVTRPASCFTNTVLAGRCLNSSGRLHRA